MSSLHPLQSRSSFGAWIRRSRQELGWTQEELAWWSHVAQASISNYETGRHDIPLSIWIDMCRALGKRPDLVLGSLLEADDSAAG